MKPYLANIRKLLRNKKRKINLKQKIKAKVKTK